MAILQIGNEFIKPAPPLVATRVLRFIGKSLATRVLGNEHE